MRIKEWSTSNLPQEFSRIEVNGPQVTVELGPGGDVFVPPITGDDERDSITVARLICAETLLGQAIARYGR